MPKTGLTEILCVLDRSGSMRSIIKDAIGGFNSFLDTQKQIKEGEANMTIAMFDDEYDLICESKNIQEVEDFTSLTYVPRGATALNDAIAKTVITAGERFSKLPEDERPEKVICVILTDGEENRSVEYKLDDVKKLIEQQENEWNWEFVFLSSDVNAFSQGAGYGIRNTSRVAASGRGTKLAYDAMSRVVGMSRKCGSKINLKGEIK